MKYEFKDADMTTAIWTAQMMQKEARKRYLIFQQAMIRFKAVKSLSSEPFIVDQQFRWKNPAFEADIDLAERLRDMTEHLTEILKPKK